MKIRNLMGAFLSLAFTAIGARAFAAGGDISEIWAVGETDYERAVTPVSSASVPLKAGDRVRFAIRLLKRNPMDKPWRLAHIGMNTETHDMIYNPMKIGIYVSGVPHYATYDGEIPYSNYTDFYFTYTVEHGDFALPVVLAVGSSAPKPAVGDKLRDTEYYFDPKGAAAWQFNNSTVDAPESGEKAVLSFKQSVDIENPDYDLRGAGFYVKTIDFEGIDDVEPGKPWRSVEAGTTKSDQTPRLAVDNYTALTNPVTLYVWSLDESVVRLTGAGVSKRIVHYPDSRTAVERQVLAAKLSRGDSELPFKLEAAGDAAGKEAQLVLCAFSDFTYAEATELPYEDYTLATVAVTEKSDPYMMLTKVGDEDAKRVDIKATSDYYVSTALQLQFSQAYTNGDVRVSLRQFFGETPATADDDVVANRYLSFQLDPDADPTSSPSLEYITVPKGSAEPVKFYVFALGSSLKTRKSPYLTLKPDLYEDQPEAVTNFFAAGRSHQRNMAIKLDDQAPVIAQPKEGAGYTAGAGAKFAVGIEVSDNWRDLQESWATNGYTVAVEGRGVVSFVTNGVHFADGDLLEIGFTAAEESGEAVIKVTDPEGHVSEAVEIDVNVVPRPRAEVLFYTDSTRQTRYFGDFYEHDAATPYYLDISFNKGTAPANMYAFLVPQDENAKNLVQCDAVSNGLYVVQGYTNSQNAVAVSFLDGFSAKSPMAAKFKVVFKSTPTIDDPSAVDYTDSCGNPSVEMKVVNRPSTVTAVKLDTESAKPGGTFYNVPAGIAKKYRAKVFDLSEVDLRSGEGYEGKEVWVRFEYTDDWNGWEQAPSKNLYTTNGLNNYADLNIAFTYEGTVQRVNVYALDKDSRAAGVEMDELDWGEPLFTFYVSVAAPQRVVIHDKQKKAVTDEDELVYFEDQMPVLAVSSGDFYISLSAQPGSSYAGQPPISSANPLRVKVTLEQYGDGVLDIHTNYVYYTKPADMALKPIRIDTTTLNGGRESVWWLTAEVDMENPDAKDSDGHPWNEHFAAASCMVRVNNVDPVIDTASAKGTRSWSESGTNVVSVGENVVITWQITDITNDFYEADWKDERFQIEWSVDSGDAVTYPNPQIITNDWPRKKGVGSKGKIYGDYKFNVPDLNGYSTIRMVVTDGDGGRAEKEWMIYVSPSKRAKVGVYGPRATAESKYKAARGVGQGLVAASGTIALCEQFSQTWEYDETTADAEFYAFGYPATNTWAQFLVDYEITEVTADNTKDEGKIPSYLGYTTLHGVPLNKLGNKHGADAIDHSPYYNWATHGGVDPDAGRYDSYFYRWVQTKAAETKEGGGTDEASPAPTTWPFDGTSKTFTLDNGGTGGDSDSKKTANGVVTYGTVGIEAVFSRELRERDNLGDINADGIPDKIVELYGLGAEAVGKFPEDDLASLAAFNDDLDFLPVTSDTAVYSSLIPGLPESWGVGQEFTAKLEVRGFHEGLNDGAHLAGLSQQRLEAGFNSDDVEVRKAARDYGDVEMMAWAEHGYAKDWSPERPTDPTKADTDEDQYPDGYEYFFWYRAHVGYLENGVHKYLTGRAYDPRNPGTGTFIDSATIARMMDPRSDLAPVDFPEGYVDDASGALTRDSDNDGLPDLLEFEIGTNPFDFDTDGDGLPDGWEIMIGGTDPLMPGTSADAKDDGMRNYDGDAMAITSYALEQTQKPVPLEIDHAQFTTFAVIKDDGDTDGVQWYAVKGSPASVPLAPATNAAAAWSFKLAGDSRNYISYTEPKLTDDGKRLMVSLAKGSGKSGAYVSTKPVEVVTEGDEEGALVTNLLAGALYPVRIAAGSAVQNVSEEKIDVEVKTLASNVTEKVAFACWIYGKGPKNALYGEVSDTAADYGCLALGRPLAAKKGAQVVVLPGNDRDVAFLHYLVYQEFGFDPRTAWSSSDPVHPRWGKTTSDGEAVQGVSELKQGGYTGSPARTRDYRAYDEFLVYSFFLNNGCDMTGYTAASAEASYLGQVWTAFCTNPRGPDEPAWASDSHYTGWTAESLNGTNGADTDNDGVPDGWELYVMAGPKNKNGTYVFAPPYAGFVGALGGESGKLERSYFSPFLDFAKKQETNNQIYLGGSANDDGLNEFCEFEGTDSTGWYADVQTGNTSAYSTTVVHDGAWTWFNKFFPTDPWSSDTDGDGLKDGTEKSAFAYGTPADDGKLWSIPGGGLNPCTVDTDLDGLPDEWEYQFKGKTVYAGEYADYAPDAAGNQGNPLQGFTDGMDGTVKDAFSYPIEYGVISGGNTNVTAYVKADGFRQVVNRDYDRDGLENWQEYLTGTMRCWRYDDPLSSWTYIPRELYYKQQDGMWTWSPDYAALGVKDRDEFWYKTLVDTTSPIYNPELVTDSSPANYFSRVKNAWDCAYIDPDLDSDPDSGLESKRVSAYYWLRDRIGDKQLSDLWGAQLKDVAGANTRSKPSKYACCSPINADSDYDGMDDYYELFHGLNPLLGQSGVRLNTDIEAIEDKEGNAKQGPCDLIYDAWTTEGGDSFSAWGGFDGRRPNFWQLDPGKIAQAMRREGSNGYDFEVFPWLNGIADADPDGDILPNQEEALMPKLSKVATHTDPSPLWMTDTSYSNSLTRMFFRLPTRYELVWPLSEPSGGATFTYDGTTYRFTSFDNWIPAKGSGESETPAHFGWHVPDAWKLAAENKMNWIFSFEENEGYDSDHDGISDTEEKEGKLRLTASDPQDADSPRRRQAMYFQGPSNPSILQTMPFVREEYPTMRGYPDDMAFIQFSVECWVKPESLADSIILERAVWTGLSSPADAEYMRKNFQLGIRTGADGSSYWFAKYDPVGTADDTHEVVALSKAPADASKWTHLAATYDGKSFVLYVNGKPSRTVSSEVPPSWGASVIAVTRDRQGFWFDREHALKAIIIGAGAKTQADGAKDGGALDVTRARGFGSYTGFFTGWIDEVRIWDGARTADEIDASWNVRYTAELAAKNRSDFYDEWVTGKRRYEKDGSGKDVTMLAELRFHWAFDSIFGAQNENALAVAPHAFDGFRATLSRPEGYVISWWKDILDSYGSLYDGGSANWVSWIPNTVTHLPRFDGTTLDSVYWCEDYMGAVAGTYRFARTAEPVSLWTQYIRNRMMSELAYQTTGSRHFDFNMNSYNEGTKFATLFSFTGRNLNQSGDDLLPLGGAYARACDKETDLWDGQGPSTPWEITGDDPDGDGLPKWWEEYADENYRGALTPAGDIGWKTILDYNGLSITAGEAYLRDLAKGSYQNEKRKAVIGDESYRQVADEDANGIPDWWADIYGIRGETGLDDHDNDGLPNYVEYLLSEVFAFRLQFNPTVADSVQPGIPDYFYRPDGSQIYVGELFTDHDLVDDAWEDVYPVSYASRLAWDAFADNDQDGWSNRSENRYSKMVMPIVANQQSHYTAADGLVADYPIPTLALTLSYNGNRQEAVNGAPIAVQVTTADLEQSPDATYQIGAAADTTAGTGTASATEKGSESATEVARTRTIGKWSDRRVVGTLTPGNIKVDTIKIQNCYDPSSLTYAWRVLSLEEAGRIKRGTRSEYDADLRKYGESNIELLSTTTGYKDLQGLELRTDGETSSVATWTTKSGNTLGTVNLVTGEFDIDLGVFKGWSVHDTTNETTTTAMEDQTFRIAYATNPSVGLPRKLYLGEADTGHVKEGKNTIIAWAETVSADGVWQVGEPYGMVRDVDVSWRGTSAEIELTDISPITPRIDLTASAGGASGGGSKSGASASSEGDPTEIDEASDRGMTVSAIKAKLLEDLKYAYDGDTSSQAYSNALARLAWLTGNIIDPATVTSETFRGQRLRVVRWLINGVPAYRAGSNMRTVLDKSIETDIRSCLTEADFLVGNESFDIDWDNLYDEVIDNPGVYRACGEVVDVSYLVVIGDGPDDWRSYYSSNYTVRALSSVIIRKFGKDHVTPVAVAPGATQEEIVHDANPTFKWTMDCPEVEGYTAFDVQVMDGSTLIYDSGKQLAPPRNDRGEYVWSAPLYVGDKTLEGEVFANKKSYTWKVSMYNAKFSDAAAYSDPGRFFMEVQTNGYVYGTANVAVRYFGPTSTWAKNSPVIRVRAYTSPDFTGQAVAAGYVADPADPGNGLTAGTNAAPNCTVVGIPKGTYYLQAFVDSNGNGVCDPWETQGYLCTRDGTTPDYLDPTAITFDSKVGKGDLAVIYLEDADTDADGLPDAWEYAEFGSLTEKGVELLSETKAGEVLVNPALSGALELQANAPVPTAGLAGEIGRRLGYAGTLMLAMGAPFEGSDNSFTAAIEGYVSPELAEDGVKITGLSISDGKVVITVEAETEGASSAWVETKGTLEVLCQVKWRPSLTDSAWTNLGEPFAITVGAEASELDISERAPQSDSGFYSVEVYKK